MSSMLRESLEEFWTSTSSKVGVAFLIVLVLVSGYVLLTMPLDFGTKYWNNPIYWVENPKSAPPTWVNLFLSEKLLEHTILTTTKVSKTASLGSYYIKYYILTYELTTGQTPSFLIWKIKDVRFYDINRPPQIRLQVKRPDGKVIDLYTLVVETPANASSSPPYIAFSDGRRFLLSGDRSVAYALSRFLVDEFGGTLTPSEVQDIGVEKVIFGTPQGTGFGVLKGRYTISVILYASDAKDEIGEITFVFGGRAYGLMGTDTIGRDLFQGLLFGFPIALAIGFASSVLTTVLGSTLGIISGYVGGTVDNLIQRIADVVSNIPLLPLLIFFSFVFGGHLWLIILVLVAFGWSGLTIIVRSMVLSIKSAPFVESAIAAGASRWRIMTRHIFPQVAPYVLAQLIFFTPSAILWEAALSFLGLGDPSVPTWGQILDQAYANGALTLGYWWWVIPPGLLIVYSAVTFVFIALGMEPVINPKLRRMR